MSTFDLVLAVLLSAAATDTPPPAAAADSAQRVSLAAISPDVHAIVLRTDDGKLTRYAEGASIGAEWRLKRVERDDVTLEAVHRLGGEAVEIRLRRDESIDLGASAAMLSALRTPAQRPQRTQLIVPQKKRPPVANP